MAETEPGVDRLPLYAARQSVEQTLYETLRWFDKSVTNAPPRAAAAAAN